MGSIFVLSIQLTIPTYKQKLYYPEAHKIKNARALLAWILSSSPVVRGHHIYKSVWTPVLGEELECRKETNNSSDPYAIAVLKTAAIVGHIP